MSHMHMHSFCPKSDEQLINFLFVICIVYVGVPKSLMWLKVCLHSKDGFRSTTTCSPGHSGYNWMTLQ